MPLSNNSRLLVKALQETVELDGRYQNIRLVNADVKTGTKRGEFSLVFRAFDRIDECDVALKFFDVDPNNQRDRYRLDSFRREHDILQSLLSKERCLQLASALTPYELQVAINDTDVVTLTTDYFAVQWLDHALDAFFLGKQQRTALEKLLLFNEIVLSVAALHRHEVFHRDVKPDNLRSHREALKRIVVAIDLGTAARFDSEAMRPEYQCSVGAPAYASPEAFCGLAGNRTLARQTDVYALGCLLFELFNRDLFVSALTSTNPRYTALLAGMQTYLRKSTDDAGRLAAWQHGLNMHASGAGVTDIAGAGSTIPPGIVPMLNDILRSMTHFDYRQRVKTLDTVSARIWSCIRCLENEALYASKLKRLKISRERRLQKLRQRESSRDSHGLVGAAK